MIRRWFLSLDDDLKLLAGFLGVAVIGIVSILLLGAGILIALTIAAVS